MKPVIFALLLTLSVISAYSQNSDWTYVNPNPQNNFYAIRFFNQNTGYVIGSGGVILKNTTGSSNWAAIPSFTTRDLYAMHFFNVNTGYIVGDGGTIMYTDDGCASWTTIATGDGYALRSVTFVNQNTGFVVGDHGELYKTTSGITGWIPSVITTKNLRRVFFLDSLNGYICGDSGKFLRTTNCGVNWSVQTVGTGNLTGVSFINQLTGYLSGYNIQSYRTTDGGNNWTNFQVGYWNAASVVKFANQITGYTVGTNGPISRTTNGGTNWSTWCSEQLTGGNTYNDISPVDSFTAYVCGNDGWILRCYGGTQPLNEYCVHIGGMRSPFSRISFVNASTGAMMGRGSTLLITTNGGAKWNINFHGSNSWFEGSSGLTRIWLFSPNSWYKEMYSPGIGGPSFTSIQQSTDGGLTWAGRSYGSIFLGIGDVFESGGVTYLTCNSQVLKNSGASWSTVYSDTGVGTLYFADSNKGFVASGSYYAAKSVLYTSDGGTNWTTHSTGSTKPIESVFLRTSGLGFAGCDSSLLLRTTNFGANWSQVSVPNNLQVQGIKFVNDYTGWFVGTDHNYNSTGRLYVSTNGGAYFQQMQSLMNLNVRGFSFVDAYTGYVQGDTGVVVKTTNGGLTFFNPQISNVPESFSLSQNYPNPFNPSTTIKFAVPNTLLSFGEGPGVRRSVRLLIYDALGREITTLVNEQLQPGEYAVTWDASAYPSGVYFYKLSAGDYSQTKKMVLLK